jgi:2-oxoglutarate dehydrogenase E2 component (dihydrolipoamide succinyltransferase)
MAIELKVPEIGESITEVEIGDWLKKQGDDIRKDEPVVTLESEKATVELPSPSAGTLSKVLKQPGEVARVGEVIAYLESNGKAASAANSPEGKPGDSKTAPPKSSEPAQSTGTPPAATDEPPPSRKAQAEQPAKPRSQRQTEPTSKTAPPEDPPAAPDEASSDPEPAAPTSMDSELSGPSGVIHRQEESVPMSRLRRTVAERLVEAQRNAALLTTFNEIDMSAVLQLRKEFAEAFLQRYQVKLGFMSFFVKAAIDALKQFPAINARIRGNDVVYHNYFDVCVAIGSGKGLVVPVLRNAERLSFAEVESAIGDFGRRAKENRLKPDELQGGTFTISNGGVYGSLLSTPIVNPPQSGVLGMHAIQERPIALQGNVVIRPMMYIALTYDHRIVDGREAVSFLKRVKDAVESPARMLIEV